MRPCHLIGAGSGFATGQAISLAVLYPMPGNIAICIAAVALQVAGVCWLLRRSAA